MGANKSWCRRRRFKTKRESLRTMCLGDLKTMGRYHGEELTPNIDRTWFAWHLRLDAHITKNTLFFANSRDRTILLESTHSNLPFAERTILFSQRKFPVLDRKQEFQKKLCKSKNCFLQNVVKIVFKWMKCINWTWFAKTMNWRLAWIWIF